MVNHTPKPIVFKYFFMVFACSCAKRMIPIYKNIQKPRTSIAFRVICRYLARGIFTKWSLC